MIVIEGAAAISNLGRALLARGAKAICLLGGLAKVYPPYLDADVRRAMAEPQADAVDGAIMMAQARTGPCGALVMSLMAAEAREAPEAVARFLDRNAARLAELGARLQASSPPVVLTSARGSSDNAAGYFKYLCEIVMGVPCASVGASVVSVYGGRLKAADALCLTISQSGQSPDILALQEAAKAAGAISVAIVNVEDSPAARNADICLALHAGEERSVAATKSFIVSCVAGAAIVAHWSGDAGAALGRRAPAGDAGRGRAPDVAGLHGFRARMRARSIVLGRGPSFPIAQETALKLKETCAIHAEAYSVAEVMHGPWELMEAGFPGARLFARRCRARDHARGGGEDAARGADVRVVERRLAMRQRPSAARPAGDDPDRLSRDRAARHGTRPRSGPAAPSQESDGNPVMAFALTGCRIFTGESFPR